MGQRLHGAILLSSIAKILATRATPIYEMGAETKSDKQLHSLISYMFEKRFFVPGLAHASYLFGSNGQAAVVEGWEEVVVKRWTLRRPRK